MINIEYGRINAEGNSRDTGDGMRSGAAKQDLINAGATEQELMSGHTRDEILYYCGDLSHAAQTLLGQLGTNWMQSC
jgi:hypothetical protein